MPIYEAMREPRHFRAVFAAAIAFIAVVNACFAMVVYFAYGPRDVPTVAILVLADESWLGAGLVAAYAAALLLSFPLVMLPATRILEALVRPAPAGPSMKASEGRQEENICLYGTNR